MMRMFLFEITVIHKISGISPSPTQAPLQKMEKQTQRAVVILQNPCAARAGFNQGKEVQ